MDLFALDLIERRKKVKVTMLRQIDNTAWTPREISVLANLKPMAVVSQLPAHPTIALIQGGPWSKDEVSKALGHNRFEHEIVEGLDNPRLPFEPTN